MITEPVPASPQDTPKPHKLRQSARALSQRNLLASTGSCHPVMSGGPEGADHQGDSGMRRPEGARQGPDCERVVRAVPAGRAPRRHHAHRGRSRRLRPGRHGHPAGPPRRSRSPLNKGGWGGKSADNDRLCGSKPGRGRPATWSLFPAAPAWQGARGRCKGAVMLAAGVLRPAPMPRCGCLGRGG